MPEFYIATNVFKDGERVIGVDNNINDEPSLDEYFKTIKGLLKEQGLI